MGLGAKKEEKKRCLSSIQILCEQPVNGPLHLVSSLVADFDQTTSSFCFAGETLQIIKGQHFMD